jgi:hypothetical protein
MHIGILDELQMWLFPSMKTQAWFNKYNAIRLSVPTYNDLTHKHYSYEEFLQWNGKDIKEMSQYLLGVVTQPVRGGSPLNIPASITESCAHRYCPDLMWMLHTNLMMMQHGATWRTPSVRFPPSKMISYSVKPAIT